jgi:hypothetical protein
MPRLNSDHIHTFARSRKNKDIYKCIHPDCTHYTDREYLVGKRALCGKCASEFILDRVQLKNALPVCLNCTKSARGKKFTETKTLLTDIFSKVEEMRKE